MKAEIFRYKFRVGVCDSSNWNLYFYSFKYLLRSLFSVPLCVLFYLNSTQTLYWAKISHKEWNGIN